MPEFLRLGIVDIIDIVLVGLLIYQVYKIIRGTAAVSIFIGIIFVYFIWMVVKALHMELLTTILDKIISVTEGSGGGAVYPLYAKMDGMGGGGSSVEPGSTSISKTVTVIWSLK